MTSPPDVAGEFAAADAAAVLAGDADWLAAEVADELPALAVDAAGDAFDELQPAASARPETARVARTLFRACTGILQFVWL